MESHVIVCFYVFLDMWFTRWESQRSACLLSERSAVVSLLLYLDSVYAYVCV